MRLIYQRRRNNNKGSSSSYQVLIAFFIGSGFGIILAEMKHGLIGVFLGKDLEINHLEEFMMSPQSAGAQTSKDLSLPSKSSSSSSEWITAECQAIFDQLRDGMLEDPNYTDERMITTALHSRFTVTKPAFHISLHKAEYDLARWSIMGYGKYYETGLTDNFQKVFLENPGGILIDVGMNIGWFSLWGLAIGAEVYAFEPNPLNRLRFCESAKLNQFSPDKIHLYGDAVSDKRGDLVLAHKKLEPGSAKLMEPDQVAGLTHLITHKVKLSRLDDIATEHGWLIENNSVSIALLKVDVEGHDAQVLFGAKELLRSGRVENLFMEYSCSSSMSEAVDEMKEVGIQLVESGYTIHEIGNYRGVARKDAYEAVMGEGAKENGNLPNRLYSFCRHEDETRKGPAQLNVWWKKLIQE